MLALENSTNDTNVAELWMWQEQCTACITVYIMNHSKHWLD